MLEYNVDLLFASRHNRYRVALVDRFRTDLREWVAVLPYQGCAFTSGADT